MCMLVDHTLDHKPTGINMIYAQTSIKLPYAAIPMKFHWAATGFEVGKTGDTLPEGMETTAEYVLLQSIKRVTFFEFMITQLIIQCLVVFFHRLSTHRFYSRPPGHFRTFIRCYLK